MSLWSNTGRTLVASALCGAAGLLAACKSEPTLAPLTPEERSMVDALRKYDRKSGVVEDKGTLFMSLRQNLRTLSLLSMTNRSSDVEQIYSIEEVLTRQVYYNFDAILNEFEHGTDPEQQSIAAAALGFSRIPAPDEPGGDPAFPALHPRAVAPLLKALESGNDELVQNALLSIGRIGAPGTPRQILVEMMITHHNQDVRRNAALALAKIVTPADAPLVLAPFISALSDLNAAVRQHAVLGLGRLKDKSAQAPLLNLFRRDPVPLVQACAAQQLGELGPTGDPAVVKYLIDGLRSDVPLIQQNCQLSLVKLTGQTKLKNYKDWREWWNEQPANLSRPEKT